MVIIDKKKHYISIISEFLLLSILLKHFTKWTSNVFILNSLVIGQLTQQESKLADA